MSITTEILAAFEENLRRDEKSAATREKYLRDVRLLYHYAGNRPITKELMLSWKEELTKQGYAVRSVNSMLASANSLLDFLGRTECKVRQLRTQHQTYAAPEQELTKSEYCALLRAAQGNERLWLLLQTICATGIRVSELQYFTVESLRNDRIYLTCKGKSRMILIPSRLKQRLLQYARKKGITSGAVFVTRNGIPLDRSNIWSAMKQLCRMAGVDARKVFPHNLRKLFARTYYRAHKDIAKLADILGHSSVTTTRIYIMSTWTEHQHQLERLNLLA